MAFAAAALLLSPNTVCCSAVSQASTAGLPGHSRLAHNYSQPAAFGSLLSPFHFYVQPPPRASHPQKSQFHNFEKKKKYFLPDFQFFELWVASRVSGASVCWQLRLRVSMVGGRGGGARQSPRSRYGGAPTASRQPSSPPRVRRAHVTDTERLGESATVPESTCPT